MINQATKNAITTNRSIEEHDANLHEMELKWCHERPGIFPDHIHIMFTTVRSHLEARDAKQASRAWTATRYELADFEGTMEGENEKKQREEREEMEKEMIEKGREEEKREEEEEQVREEGVKQVADMPGDVNDCVVMSRSPDRSHPATNE